MRLRGVWELSRGGSNPPFGTRSGGPGTGCVTSARRTGTPTGIVDAPRFRAARRCAPSFRSAARAARRPRSRRGWSRGTRLPAAPGSGIETSSRAFSALRQVPIPGFLFFERGAPLSHIPPVTQAANKFAAISFWACREGLPPTKKKRGDGLERRPPVGTAPRSGANGVRLSCAASAAGEGTPASPPGGSLQTGTAAQSAARRAMPDGAEQPDRGIALTIPRHIALWSAFP